MNYRAVGWFSAGVLATVLSVSGSLADIRETPHNFTRNSQGKRAGDKEVCAFCHTPALALGPEVRPAPPPAWQHATGTGAVFTIYDDIGRLGLGKPSIGSQSMACLSCHDANQAVAVNSSGFDHPFGVPYRGFTKANAGIAGFSPLSQNASEAPSIAARSLVALEAFRSPSSGTVEGRSVWWVSSLGITGRRGKSDLPLFTRATHGAVDDGIPYVECGSCHDPHSANKTFLRVANDASRLCLTCHEK